MRILIVALTACLFASPAHGQYGGGTGEPNDPYLVYTAEHLNAIGTEPNDWDKHFKLMADIDLSSFSYDAALIAPDTNDTTYWLGGSRFTGVFKGNGHTISHLTMEGEGYLGLFGQLGSGAEVRNVGVVDVNISGSTDYVGGLVGCNRGGVVTGCYSTGVISGGGSYVGGLAGQSSNWGEVVTYCYSTCMVSGKGQIGGLVGYSSGHLSQCFSTGTVTGIDGVGGLVGHNGGDELSDCFSTGAVNGGIRVGGLVGRNDGAVIRCYCGSETSGNHDIGGLVGRNDGDVRGSFWDTDASGLSTMCGSQDSDAAGCDDSLGKTTAEMQTADIFLGAGWDFVDEKGNGTNDIWCFLEGHDYPRLACELEAFSPNPRNGAIDVIQSPILRWHGAIQRVGHDVYVGKDEDRVSNATPQSPDVYRGRQPADQNTYDPGVLEVGRTYHWRIDEVNQADPNDPRKGRIWSFSTADFLVTIIVDDFESYRNDPWEKRVFWTWIDGLGFSEPGPGGGHPGNGTGAFVGHDVWTVGTRPAPPIMEIEIVHSGSQSMPLYYDNSTVPFYAETERSFMAPSYWTPDGVETLQDWTINDADTLTLYFHGGPDNDPEPLYVAIEDSAGQVAMVTDPDANAVLATEWQRWHIPLADLRAAGVDVASVRKMTIGIGDRDDPQPGGAGLIYIDDIWITKQMP